MINTVVMQGRLTFDPVLKTTMSGKELCVFSIAQNYRKGETEETDFFDVKAFDAQAKYVCDYFSKGDIITVAGKLRSRRYEGSDGVKRVAFEIIAMQVGDKERPRRASSTTPQAARSPFPASGDGKADADEEAC